MRMQLRHAPVAAVLAALAVAGCASTKASAPAGADTGAEWKWGGDLGPSHWGSLDPSFALCDTGRRQSPVDLTGAQHAPTSALRLAYHHATFRTVDNGHTIEAEVEGRAGGIVLGSTRYELVQFHFHAPSEHTLAGRGYAMELHLVHRAADGRLAVIGVLIREGGENAALAELFEHVPAKGAAGELELDPSALLPPDRAGYRYEGSLTTPPCTEGVRWIVMREPIELSAGQLLAFKHRYFGTVRPVQPLNGRMLATTG